MLYSIKPIVNHNNDKTMFNTAITAAMNVSSMTPIEFTLKKCDIKFTKKVSNDTTTEIIAELNKEQAKILYGFNYKLTQL